MKTTKAKGAQSATSLPRAPEDDLHNRTVRYGLTMLIRTVCFILMVAVHPYGWWTLIFAVGAIFLPYFAVVVANVGYDALAVKVRALTSAELLKVNGEDDEAAARALQISLACVEPAFTSEQAERIVQELPYTESSKILAKINELTFSEVKTPDFSPAS